MRWRILGPVEVRGEGAADALRGHKRRLLLGVLLLHPNTSLSRSTLVDYLWDGRPPRSARANLHSYVTQLRRLVGDRLDSTPEGYRMRVEADELDADRFERLAAEGQQALSAGDVGPAIDRLGRALALWRGDVLDGTELPAQVRPLTTRLAELRLAATEDWFDARLLAEDLSDPGAGPASDLVAELLRHVEAHPLRERFHGQLLVALHRSGRTPEALAAYRRFRTRLVDDLGVEPGPALQRLHQAILAGDLEARPQSDAERPAPRPVPRQLPADVATFTGRSAELAALDTLLPRAESDEGPVVVAAVTGTAGVGKTALALHWAHRVASRFPDGTLYVDLRGYGPGAPAKPVDALGQVLRSLGVPPEEVPDDEVAAAALYRSVQAGHRRLIVLDNARDAAHARPLLPGGPGGHVIVTSRSGLSGLLIGGATMVELDLLPAADARRFLARRIGPRVDAEPDAADRLVDLCSRLPLALAVVAARATVRPAWPLSVLVDDLRASRHPLARLAGGGDTATDLRRVLSWSYDALSPPAARLFRRMGLHPGPDISVPAAASLAAIDLDTAHDLVAELLQAHLMVETAPGRVTFHDLLRAYAAELTEAEDAEPDRAAALRRLLDHYLHTARDAALQLYPSRDPVEIPPAAPGVTPEPLDGHDRALAWFRAERPVLLTAIRRAAEAGPDAHAELLAWTLADHLHRTGHWQDWATSQAIAVEAARTLGDRRAEARAHRSLGRANAQLGRFAEAHTEFGHALRLFAALADDIGQAHTWLNEGFLFDREGRHDRALAVSEQALERYRAAGHLSGCALSLNMIGWENTRLGRHREAAPFCTEALQLHEHLGDDAGQAATWDSLGGIHHSLGEHERAIGCYEQSLALFQKLGDRYQEAETLTHLGDAHAARAETSAADDAWRAALTILQELGHSDADAVRRKLAAR